MQRTDRPATKNQQVLFSDAPSERDDVETSIAIHDITQPFPGYRTYLGRYWNTSIEEWLDSRYGREFEGKVDLILTSPPFPLNEKKSYGNLDGEEYLDMLRKLATRFAKLISETGSLVLEIGNAWNKDEPTVSTLPLKTLLAVKEAGDFHLCQEFICHNPARLPTPVQYVNVERIRMKDSWTRIWWLSKVVRPKANNRNVLLPYSKSMRALLKKQSYNAGPRPSQHVIGERSFLVDNGGAIAASCITQDVFDHFNSMIVASNTMSSGDPYLEWCREHGIKSHPARMQMALARFFISFLTDKNDMVLDPFAGSNTTGAVAQELKRQWASVEVEGKNLEPSKARFR